MSKMTTFDFVLLLIVGEASQQALLGHDFSLTGSLLVISTLVAMDFLFSIVAYRFSFFDKLTNGVPVVIMKNGKLIEDRMRRSRVEVDDILESARQVQGLESLDQIEYAVLEKDGKISIIPKFLRPNKAEAN